MILIVAIHFLREVFCARLSFISSTSPGLLRSLSSGRDFASLSSFNLVNGLPPFLLWQMLCHHCWLLLSLVRSPGLLWSSSSFLADSLPPQCFYNPYPSRQVWYLEYFFMDWCTIVALASCLLCGLGLLRSLQWWVWCCCILSYVSIYVCARVLLFFMWLFL